MAGKPKTKTVTVTDYREETTEVKRINPELVAYGFTEEQAKDLLANPDHTYFTWKSGFGGDKDIWYTKDDWVAGLWDSMGSTHKINPEDVYITETTTKMVPYEKEIEVELDDPPIQDKQPKVVYVGGNTSSQDQRAQTTTTQEGRQSQGTDQTQGNDSRQSMQGQGNVALVVTPNAESNQQLESQAFGSASQTQQVEVASQADAASAMTNEQYASAAQYSVAPVINVDAADVYYTTSTSDRSSGARNFTPQLDGSTAVLITVGVVAGIYLLSRVISSRPAQKSRQRASTTRRSNP